MVGSSFIEKYFPLSANGMRGLRPVLVFGLTLLFLIFLDYLSLQWFKKLEADKLAEMQQRTIDLVKKVLPEAADQSYQGSLKQIYKLVTVKGFFTELLNSPMVTYYLDFFRMGK